MKMPRQSRTIPKKSRKRYTPVLKKPHEHPIVAIAATGIIGMMLFVLTAVLKSKTVNAAIIVNTISGKAEPSAEKSRYIFPVLSERKSRKSLAIRNIPLLVITLSISASIMLSAVKPSAIYRPIFLSTSTAAQISAAPTAIIT